jgi:transposase
MIAMEATIFTGWIYDHLLPHAEKVKVANPLMLRAIAAAKRKSDTISVCAYEQPALAPTGSFAN